MKGQLVAVTVALALSFLAAPRATDAQSSPKVPRIGVLDTSSLAASSGRIESFRKGLRELGHIEGQTVKIEWRFAEGKEVGLSNLAAELVGLKPDVLVSLSGAGIRALRNATTAIPIVMAGADTLGMGRAFAESLARPGGNITGVISIAPELEGKRMELLREAVPGVSRMATFWDSAYFRYRAGEAATSRPERWGLTFIPIEVRGPDDFEGAFAAAIKERAGALSLLNTPMFYTSRRRLAELAVKNRLAWVAGDREYAEAGCLMSYGADGKDLAHRAASYVDKILKGAKPADLPIEQPTKFDLVINRKTAKALGLSIPQSLLLRADQIID